MTTNDQNTRDNQLSTRSGVHKAGGMGSLLRTLAGTPAGWQPSRRGSFLVLVVGTLALLAVMAIIYSSIGNHDVRMKAAVAKHEKLEEAPEQIKNYLLSIIGDSVIGTYYDTKDGVTGSDPVLLSRVTFDFPSTSYLASSDPTTLIPTATAIPFTPTGSVTGAFGTFDFARTAYTQMPDTWRPSTPWLADSEPTFLNWGQLTGIPPEERHWYRRDWAHISNIAPDGRFINLHNFRDNFDAEPGFSNSGNNGRPQTSFRVNQAFAANGSLGNVTDFGLTIPATALPAHLDSRQAWMFRPAKPSGTYAPNSQSFEPYLFADADGDGMFDSRWQELVDARILKNYLSVDPRFRYAVAVRITDLSGNINVNTATDSMTAAAAPDYPEPGPRAIAPAGLSPAEVDLHRLLSGQVPFEMAGLNAGFGMDGIYGSTLGAATASSADYGDLDQEISLEMGNFAYTALRLKVATGFTPPADTLYAGVDLVPSFTGQVTVQADEYDFTNTPEKRWEYYSQTSRSIQSASFSASPSQATFRGDFGLDDLSELVTRRAVNDPSITSSLELTLGGRRDDAGGLPDRHSPLRSNRGLDVELERAWPPPNNYAQGVPFDQMMLFFNADVRQRLTTVSGSRELRQAPSYGAVGSRSIDPYTLSTNELRVDPKRYLSDIKDVDVQTGAISAADQAKRHTATNKLFRTYVDALAPRLGVGDPWAENATSPGPRTTEFYGYRGPELAVRIAAHMTVNLIDAFDNQGIPTVHTVLLDRDFATTIQGFANTSAEGLAFAPWKDMTPATNQSRALQLPDELLGSVSNGHSIQAPAVNVFGVEAQPFITQAASFTVYADTYRLAGGDGESPGNPANINGAIDFASNPDLMYRVVAFQLHNPFDTEIQLGGRVAAQSEHYNVNDPRFPRLDREQSYFYLNFGGRTFKLASLEQRVYVTPPEETAAHAADTPAVGHPDADLILGPTTGLRPDYRSMFIPSGAATYGLEPITLSPIRIPAGKTIVVYALSDTPKEIMARMAAIDSRPGTPGNLLKSDVPGGSNHKYEEFRSVILDAIEKNLGATGIEAYWIPEIDSTTGTAVIPAHTDYVTTTGTSTTVELWRALRSGTDAQPDALRNLPTRFWSTGATPRTGGPAQMAFVPNLPENDQLVDRFVISNLSTFDAKLTGSVDITGSDSADDTKLFMLTKWAAFARKANPGGAAPIGALPAFCLEPKYAANWNLSRTDSFTTLNETDFQVVGAGSFGGAGETVEAWAVNMAASAMTNNTIARGPDALSDPFPTTNIRGIPTAYQTVYPEIVLPNNDMKVPIPNTSNERVLLRPADLLLPLGIGPEEMPVDASGLVTDVYARWTTLGEAMALALGYQVDPLPTPVVDTMTQVYAPEVTDVNFWPLDRGNLRLDSFAPFLDNNTDGTFTPNTDVRVGLQIPLALNILDSFTTNPVDFEAANWGTLKRATPGTVNINTASLMTLSAGFPMLSPPPYAAFGQDLWWWGTSANPGAHDEGADLATTLVAYRNKVKAEPRPASLAALAAAGFDSVEFNIDTNGSGTSPERPDWADDLLTGRYEASGIAALHEYPGFRSVGELLSVRYQPTGTAPLPTGLDYLGRDAGPSSPGWAHGTAVPYPAGASGRIGVDSYTYTNPSSAPGAPRIPSNIVNSYKEQLAIINSVLPSVSTRSDYFCVWFLVHGYQKSDCEGLGADDPLVPSIARRFVMVVDRSKVTKKGELPEVLLFKEVPVDPVR